MKKITVIMGVFNGEKTVENAIMSIINQTYKDWVLLLCDDGSKDNSYEVMQNVAKQYPEKIVVFKNESNRGLTYTLNLLVGKTNTEYIARMDADDISCPERFEKQIEFLDNNLDYAFVGSALNKFDEEGIYAIEVRNSTPQKKDFLWNNPFAHPSTMMRTAVLNEIKGYRDISKTIRCEDYDLWFRFYEKGYKGYNLQEPLLNYYEGKNSFPNRKFKYRINEMKVRFEGYKRLGLLPIGIFYTVKPLILGVLPADLKKHIVKKRREND